MLRRATRLVPRLGAGAAASAAAYNLSTALSESAPPELGAELASLRALLWRRAKGVSGGAHAGSCHCGPSSNDATGESAALTLAVADWHHSTWFAD